MGRRITIRQLKAEALETAQRAQATLTRADITLSHADRAILETQAKAMELLAGGCELVEKVLAGKANINLQVGGKKWPIGFGIDFDQAEPAPPPTPQP
jgi:hypothetical protein